MVASLIISYEVYNVRSSLLECSPCPKKVCSETFLLAFQCGNLTDIQLEAAAYDFTTLNFIAGIVYYNDVKNQLLDLPGIIEGAIEGDDRGQQACTWNPESNCLHTAAYQRLVNPVVGHSNHVMKLIMGES